ncbi:MAG: glucosamine-6-phosphate deaminase [Trueperaceae bacterium]|jgi:glucosamine-6-phosphate deaminase
MDVVILPTPEHVAQLTARLVADRVKSKPNLVLGCATGRTMEGIYGELDKLADADQIDFSRVRTFNLDEYVGIGGSDERSYRHYMHRYFFSRVNIDPANTHVPNGLATDLDAECDAYEAAIVAAGGIDLQLLGLGSNGHIGFNEPLSGFQSRTRVQPLAPHTREQNAGMFGGDPAKVPTTALTMGVGTILDSREALLVVTGEHKADILARSLEGPVVGVITATALQFHRRCHVITDEAAAAKLSLKEFYRDEVSHLPVWRGYLQALD